MALVKTPKEIEIMKRAAKATQRALIGALPLIRAGAAEREIACELEASALKLEDVDSLAFPVIVASGPNGAQPHAEVTDRIFNIGDFITIDFGLIVDGYASDITRTFLLGPVSQTQRRIYSSVKRSQYAGLTAAKAGMACAELDAICRDIIEKDGFGEYFIHTTGHGLGTEVHEDPRIGKDSKTVLEAGMVVTIEPGIYIEGLGGVRIEDSVIITDAGCEVITPKIPKNMVSIEKLLSLID